MKSNFYALASLMLVSTLGMAQTVWNLSTTGLPNRNICNYIHAPNANVCAATVRDSVSTVNVPKIVVTSNGGATWAIKTISPAVNLVSSSIWAVDANTIFVPMYGATASTNGAIMRTTDGGTTWTNVVPAGFTAASGGFPNIVAFTNATTGICMGDPTSGYFEIYRTTDGGGTWTRVPSASIAAPVSGEYGLTDVSGVNGDNIWFGTNKGRVYHSADAGLTWTASSTHYQAAAYYVSGIAMQDANTGFAFSSGGDAGANPTDDLAKTTDGGATWTQISATGIGFPGRGDIRYMTGTTNTYFVSGTGQCKVSYNGGTTWSPTTETNGNTSFGSMTFPTATKGFSASNYFTGPVAIWDGPATPPACMSLLGTTQTGNPQFCSGDSVTYWIRADVAGDPNYTAALRYQTQGDNGVWSAAQTVNMADIGVTPTFIPDNGVGTVGTVSVFLGLTNRFGANFNEVTRWRMQLVASGCPADTTAGAAYSNVNVDIVGDPSATPPVAGCATTVINGNTISVDYAACNKTPAILTYTVVGYFLDGATTPITGSSYTATSGTHTVDFGVDNGTCFQIISGVISFVGTQNQIEASNTLYPNPATDLVNLTNASKAKTVNIFDINGRLVANQTVMAEGAVTTIPTATLVPGIYFLQTIDAQGAPVARYRFVKN